MQVETVATTLALGEQNHAAELKRVCLDFVSRNLGAVMGSEGYQHMIRSCPQLQVRPWYCCRPASMRPLQQYALCINTSCNWAYAMGAQPGL